jgi:hypothetical protein
MKHDFHNYYQPRSPEDVAAFDSEFASVRIIPASTRNIQTGEARQQIEPAAPEAVAPTATATDKAQPVALIPAKPAQIIDIAERTSPFGNFMAKAEADGLPNWYRMPVPPVFVPHQTSGRFMDRLQERAEHLSHRARRFGSFIIGAMSRKTAGFSTYVELQRDHENSNRPPIARVATPRVHAPVEMPVTAATQEVGSSNIFRKRRAAVIAGGLVLVTVFGGVGAKLAFGTDSPVEHSPRPVATAHPVAQSTNIAQKLAVPELHVTVRAPRAQVQLAAVHIIHMARGSTVWSESKAALVRAGDTRPSLASINQKTIETLRLSHINPSQTTKLPVGTILQIKV